MTILEFTAVVAIVSFVAGLLGALTGLGGGVVLVPLPFFFTWISATPSELRSSP